MFPFERMLSITIFLLLISAAQSFSPSPGFPLYRCYYLANSCRRRTAGSQLWSTISTDPSEMKLREIQEELRDLGVSYADCFDRESLTRRLRQARDGEIPVSKDKGLDTDAPSATPEQSESFSTKSMDTKASSTSSSFDREATLNELRSLRVKELRTELAERNIRWGSMVEKEDLVQELLRAREIASNFSSSGALAPGQVTDVDADVLRTELSNPVSTPLLLDVYAVWCGPCQMMSPQLKLAAEELGDSVRVAKIDSDKYPEWASQLHVGGLPTVIVFDGVGNEVERVEGALMSDGLVELARKYL